ncbi:alpha/beta fold hydrolase [Solibacillus sp.]|uniref:alpha/beta hydrolase family protein n=1 Tax=Solibacillus sp. TaxID=1909654 RepID=UPI003314E2F1
MKNFPIDMVIQEVSKKIAVIYKEKIKFKSFNFEDLYEIQLNFGQINFCKWISESLFVICFKNNKENKLYLIDILNLKIEDILLFPNIIPKDMVSINEKYFLIFELRKQDAQRGYYLYDLSQKEILNIVDNIENSEFLYYGNKELIFREEKKSIIYKLGRDFDLRFEKQINLDVLCIIKGLVISKLNCYTDQSFNVGYSLLSDYYNIHHINNPKFHEITSIRFIEEINILLITGVSFGEIKSICINISNNSWKEFEYIEGQFVPYFLEGEKVLGIYSSITKYPTLEWKNYYVSGNKISVRANSNLKIKKKKFKMNGIDIYYSDINEGYGDNKIFFYVHGGPHNNFQQSHSKLIMRLSELGYRVICIDYPGSTGYGDKYRGLNRFDWGGIDLQALIELRKAVVNKLTEVVIYGSSYGGYLSLLAAAKYPNLFNKVIAAASFNNIEHFYFESNPQVKRFLEYELGEKLKDKHFLYDRSPYNYLNSLIKTDLLLIHGEEDEICNVSQSQNLFKKVQENLGNINLLVKNNLKHEEFSEDYWAEDIIEFISVEESSHRDK